MIDEEMAEEWVKENMDCVKTVSCLNHDCNYFSDEERSIAKSAFKDGYNKANEWHFVKDEGLPINKNDGTTYLLYTIYGEGGSPVVAHFVYRDKQELMNVWTGAILTENKIVAWKEIVLPKED